MAEEIIINNKCFIASQTDLKEYMDNMTEEIKVIPTNGTSADDVKYAKRVEEVYIDGVNVAGCTYFQQEDDEYTCGAEECNGAVVGCRACNNCYYKQLKRLEQENRELRKANEISIEKVTITAEAKRLQELKQENKELKKQIESDKGLITIGGKQQYEYLQRIDELKQENKELKEKVKVLDKMTGIFSARLCNTYHSALEEIRKLTIIGVNASQCNCGLRALADDILTKINEVLNLS